MRFFSLLALAALVAAPTVIAQTTFGVKAGVQAATFTGTFDEVFDDVDGVDTQARLGFVGGVTADLGLSPNIAFRPEVLYSQKGYAVAYDGENDEIDLEGRITFEVDYLEVPLLIAYRQTTLSGLSYSVELGPTLAYALSTGSDCDLESDAFPNACDDVNDEGQFDDRVQDLDVGGAIGATVGSGPFNVGLRYTQGFTNALDAEFEGDDRTARNSVFSASLIYKLGAR